MLCLFVHLSTNNKEPHLIFSLTQQKPDIIDEKMMCKAMNIRQIMTIIITGGKQDCIHELP